MAGTSPLTSLISRRAEAEPGIAERPATFNPPPDSIARMLSVGVLSLRSSRSSERSGLTTPNSFLRAASTLGAASSAETSIGVSGVTLS